MDRSELFTQLAMPLVGPRTVSRRALLGGLASLAAAGGLAGCTPSVSSNTGTGTTSTAPVNMEQELKKPANITFWSWSPGIDSQVKLFEKKYKNIKVKLVNPGQGPPAYQKLRTALGGGGAPDVAQLEFSYLQSFIVTKNLLDIAPYGANDIKGDYVDFAWQQVSNGDAVYAIPQDSGPMGMLYRNDIFEKYGLEIPTTWAEFEEQAKKLRSQTKNVYMANLPPNDSGALLGMMQQAGSRPFSIKSQNEIGLNLPDEGAKKWADYWTPLLQQGLVSNDATFNNDWFQALSSGRYATWIAAAWGPAYLQGAAAGSSGKWRAAKMPQWAAGENIAGNWGGSTSAVISGSKFPAAAAAFAMFINHDPESSNLLASKQLLFPVLKSLLSDPKFTEQEVKFYGGQKVFKLFAEISNTVPHEYQWNPFQDFVNTKSDEVLGKTISGKKDLFQGLEAMQADVVKYAEQQGFKVTQ